MNSIVSNIKTYRKMLITVTVTGIGLYILLYFSQMYNYLLFHTTVELLGVLPSFMIFVIVLYVWSYLENNNFLSFIGIAFFFIGVIDFIHTLAYEGMPIFKGFDANLTTQLWILARYTQVISIVVGCLLLKRKKQINKYVVFTIYTILLSIALYTIFISKQFPAAFIVGQGLTQFKIYSEYIIILGLLLSAYLIIKQKSFFTEKTIKLIVFSIVIQVASEFSFTTFANVFGFSNFLGHYFKLIWIIAFFSAVISTALLSPSKTIYENLLQRELDLKNINEELYKKIDELAKSQNLLKESERQLNNALDNAPIPIMLRKEDGTVLKISNKWTEITGYTLNDIPTLDEWVEKAYGNASSKVKLIIKESFEDDDLKINEDFRIMTASGEERIWQFNVANIGFDYNGQKIGLSAAVDITERQKNELALKNSEERLRLLFERMSEGFVVLEVVMNDEKSLIDFKFLEANDAYLDLSNQVNVDVIGHLVGVLKPEKLEKWLRNFSDVGICGGVVNMIEYSSRTKRYHKINAFQIDYCKIGLLFTDVTAQKKAEMDMFDAKNMAENATRAKSQFLANMSHEIRTPMNGVIGMIQLIQETELTEQQKEIINISKTSSEALLSVINDILDYSKIEVGKIILERIEFDVRDVLEHVVGLFKSIIIQKNLVLEIKVDTDVPLQLIGDAFRLRQVLSNLIGNAVKYTHDGTIRIDVTKKSFLGTQKVLLEFVIADSGIGIDLNQQQYLFTSFSQADDSDTRRYGGTGLGLSISKSLVELMSGTIWVESETDKGSIFGFTCEMEVNQKNQTEKSDVGISYSINEKDDQFRILLVEDDIVSQIVITKLLEKGFSNIEIAENGQVAYEMFLKVKYDLILMDVQMPIMGGYESTRKMRSYEKIRNNFTPIIAMTALAFEQDKTACFDAGMNDFISKPIQMDALFKKVNYWKNKSLK